MDNRIKVNGNTLRARVEGKAGAPWVVLIHSLGTNLELWDPQIPALAAHYQVLRYDMRGHGQSDAPPAPYGMDALVDDMLGLLKHYGVNRAHVVGISLGALTALQSAIRHEPTVASIAICDSRADRPPEFTKAINDRNQLLREKGLSAIDAASAERWLTPATLKGRPDLVRKVRDMVLAASVEGFVGCSEAIKGSTLTDNLGKIKVPALFVAADLDLGLPIEVMRGMQLRVPGAGFACIPGASHLSNLEQPEIFNAIILQHLKRVG